MRVALGSGWNITHLTDRVVELTKDDYTYRRFTDRDGYVRLRAEPGMDRHTMIQKAMEIAKKQDDALSFRVARQLIPSGRALEQYRAEQRQLAPVFGTSEESSLIGVKRA